MNKLITSLALLSSLTASAQFFGRAANIGDPVPGLTPAQRALFDAGKAKYQHEFTVAEGRGPLFRQTSCAACHGSPVVGGQDPAGNTNNVTHFMINNQGSYMLALEFGGPVEQNRSIRDEPAGAACTIAPESVPAMPGITTSSRHSPPVFGFGLLDAVPDAEIVSWQGRQPWKDPSVLGFPNWGTELEGLTRLRAFTFDITRKQPVGPSRVGRFGWKAQTPTLFQFTSEPFNIELGVTTPYFPRENTPDGTVPTGACQQANATPNDTGSQNTIPLFHFQALLGAPPVNPVRTPSSYYGEFLFFAAGCNDCHRAALQTGDYYLAMADGSAQKVNALSNKIIFPYSDLLIHDMGPGLEDGRVMGRASGRFWRTTPLWGNRFKNHFLHDGRVTTVHEAIAWHGGEGQHSTDVYNSLNLAQKRALVEFVEGL